MPERGPGDVLVIGPETAVVLVLVPAGSYLPGELGKEPEPDVEPAVHVDALFLSKYELTRRQWWRATGEYPGVADDPGPRALEPVTHVSWSAANRVLAQWGLALPSEEEWVYGLQAGTDGSWWRANPPSARADHGAKGVVPVGSYPANPFGLHDCLGNVSEWCRTIREDEQEIAVRARIYHGGNYLFHPEQMGPASWAASGSEATHRMVGVRPALAVRR